MTDAVTILLVDDHAVVRAGFRALLENQIDFRVIAEAENGESACRHYIEHEPDVVIMDLRTRGNPPDRVACTRRPRTGIQHA